MKQETYKITVDYGQSVEAMVKAGKYNYANSNITAANYPTQGSGKAKLKAVLVQFGRYVGSDEALAEMEKNGFRAGTLAELLALGAQHPNAHKEGSIVALGSVWRSSLGGRCVPFLWRGGSGRELRLGWFGGGWGQGDRFLAFRKSLASKVLVTDKKDKKQVKKISNQPPKEKEKIKMISANCFRCGLRYEVSEKSRLYDQIVRMRIVGCPNGCKKPSIQVL